MSLHPMIQDAGSSPRLRGTRMAIELFIVRLRFIPAPAGNTVDSTTQDRTGPVHPRACGEHERGQGNSFLEVGSSPRLRGTRVFGPARGAE